MDLKTFFDTAAERAAVIFKERGELVPMWHAIDRNGEHLLILTPWQGQEEKEEMVYGLRHLFRAKGVTRYAFMCEAWGAFTGNMEAVAPYLGGNLKNYPDRREILTINAEDNTGKTMQGWYFILRPEHAPATLSPLQMTHATEHKGLLQGMLCAS